MRRVLPILVASVALAIASLVSGVARAQVISAAAVVNPDRIINGQDVGQYTRPINLNQYGVNYADCVENMVLQYSVTLSGFTGNDNMQVWATYNGDCTADTTRGLDGTLTPTCWLVNAGETLPNFESADTRQYNIPVRALVGPEGGIPPAGTLVGDSGPGACTHQASFAAVPVTIWFLPLLPNGQLDSAPAQAYQAPVISADLVGPPPPSGVSIADGDTLFIVSWTPNTDADTQGYDVFMDPPPGSHPEAGASSPTHVLYCPDSGSSTVSFDDASLDGDDGSSLDATIGTTLSSTESPDACVYINGGGAVPNTSGVVSCTSLILAASPVFTLGATEVSATDDSGDLIDTDAAVEEGTGGITSIPCEYLSGASCAADAGAYTNTNNPSVTGLSASQLTIGGLTNGVTYNVVVSAIDGSGNVGPQSSPQQCDYPAPVNDYFKTYVLDGGRAGGGFCTLEAVGAPTGASIVSMGFGALAFGLARRRSRRRSPGEAREP
jgi:hypothetical protein